jgi:hypothetical protein
MRALALLPLTFALLTACDDPWADYAIPEPDAEARVWLDDEPFVRAEKTCVDPATVDVPADAVLENGQLCFWDFFSGTVPEGMNFGDVSDCRNSFTQGPPWFAEPERVYESPNSLADDEAWATEAGWVAQQIRSSGCACCHASSSGSGNTSGFDVDAPGVWTDSMQSFQLPMSAGEQEYHRYFGRFEAADNHGFARIDTLWPSTDPERLRAFFLSEFERRDGDPNLDYQLSQNRFDALFGVVVQPTPDCAEQFEGIDGDGVVYWNGDDEVRQVWVMEPDAETPAFPPTTDLPPGTLWAVYQDPAESPWASGTVTVGQTPAGATQQIAGADAFQLVDGQTYKVYATVDVMVTKVINCTLTWEAN